MPLGMEVGLGPGDFVLEHSHRRCGINMHTLNYEILLLAILPCSMP